MDYLSQNSSNINPVAMLFLVAMSVVTLRGQRQAAVCALLAIAAFLPLGQQFVVAGFHFQFFRILLLVGYCRLLINGEGRGFKRTRMDKLFIAWGLTCFLCGVIRKPEAWAGADCLGLAFNDFGVYFFFRFLLRDSRDILGHLRVLAILAVVIGLAMVWETTTHRNPLYVFGGVPEFVTERDGRFRCQGPFRHPILAGTFAATLLPLMLGLWFHEETQKWRASLGMLSTAFSSFVAASSGAVLTVFAACVGFALWPMRRQMRWFRWGILLAVIGLSTVMKAPVWFLIAKISDVVGGTGWHRSYLIDQAIRHFTQWCWIGSSYTANWAPSGQVLVVDPDNMDITNHYIAQGLHGGLLGLGLFIALIVTSFKIIGRAVHAKGDVILDRKLLWALGVCLACHCTAFISISYFDQIQVFWLWLLAAIASLASETRREELAFAATSRCGAADVTEQLIRVAALPAQKVASVAASVAIAVRKMKGALSLNATPKIGYRRVLDTCARI